MIALGSNLRNQQCHVICCYSHVTWPKGAYTLDRSVPGRLIARRRPSPGNQSAVKCQTCLMSVGGHSVARQSQSPGDGCPVAHHRPILYTADHNKVVEWIWPLNLYVNFEKGQGRHVEFRGKVHHGIML